MLRIRLRRTGRRKAPSYRMVVAHGRDPRDGDFVEIVGHYNPAASPKTLERSSYILPVDLRLSSSG